MEPAGLCVRAATPEDAPGIGECLSALGYATPVAAVEQKLEAFRSSAADKVFVALADGMIAGTVSVHLIPLFHAFGCLARITAASVVEGHQRSGIGTALVLAAEKWARASGALRMEVTSGDHRPGAHAFYAALGYASHERRFLKSLAS